MSDTVAGLLQVALVVAALVAVHRPLGDYMARVFTSQKHWRAERLIYRATGVDPDSEQRWPVYLRSLLAFSLISVLGLYLLLRIQGQLPWSNGTPGVPSFLAWNTAISFVTNTNWQNYGGESTLGSVAQFAGLAVQNFASAAVGLAVAIALVRGFARKSVQDKGNEGNGDQSFGKIGNFWSDLVRGCTRILLPISIIAALVLIAAGVVQNLHGFTDVSTLAGGTQSIPGGPVASQEAIKIFGTNGGGYYNANSAHPFENPTAWISLLQVFLMLAIPFSLPRTFGRMVGDLRQGYAIVSVMSLFWIGSIAAMWAFEAHATYVSGGGFEGKEVRFGIPGSTLYATSTTLTSTGAVNSFHDSFSPLGGGMAMVNMMTGELAPGGVGSGLYGMLILAVITVFIAGLMVGRTPEYLGKKLGPGEIKLAGLYLLVTPAIVLIGAALSTALPGPRSVRTNDGAHGLSEILYAFTSMGNNNGSAFGGLGTNTDFYNLAGGIAMGLGRFLPIVLVVALAGRLSEAKSVPVTDGTLPTHRPLFVGLLAGVIILVVALTYFPGFALAPLAEGLS